MKIKLIASDLDGTFLTDTKEISAFTRETIAHAWEKGIRFVPATGRAFSAVPTEVLSLSHVEYVITSNGAAIYSAPRKKRIYECLLREESVRTVLALTLPEDVTMEAFFDGVPYSSEENIAHPEKYGADQYSVHYVKRTRRAVKDIRAFIEEHAKGLDSISFLSANWKKHKALRKCLETQVPGVYMTSSVSHMLEMGNENAGKGKTLTYLRGLLGISADEAMAFGDADNDIDMLTSVKYGFAMANASDNCKEAAYAVVGNNNEDGAAKEIAQYLDME